MNEFIKLIESKTHNILKAIEALSENDLNQKVQIERLINANRLNIPKFDKSTTTYDIRSEKISIYDIPTGGTFSSSTVDIDIVDYNFSFSGDGIFFKHLQFIGNRDNIKYMGTLENKLAFSITFYKKVIDSEPNLEEVKNYAKDVITNIEKQFDTLANIYRSHLENQQKLIDKKVQERKEYFVIKKISLNKLNPFE